VPKTVKSSPGIPVEPGSRQVAAEALAARNERRAIRQK
jgi:hypothetical protein